jgi:cellulose synthase/poly-beta-1,6-N-acetylglucosamine synthase-like glycosyltransferase
LAIFGMFVLYNLVTLSLIGLSLYEAMLQKHQRADYGARSHRPLRPGISVVAPAYNEEPVIVPSVKSLLGSDYDPLEVIIVDDGSSDRTLAVLIEHFDLVPLPVGDRFPIETEPIERCFISRLDPRLRVASKANGGRSDALNAGTNLARMDLLMLTDADSLLDPDALGRVVEVFSADPDRVLAVGGAIRIANGALIEEGRVVEPRVPVRGTQASQVGEYLRAFCGARIGWASMNGLLILSGAFGVFRRDLFRAAGGLSKATLGEDMELTMRMHQELRREHPELRVAYAPDAASWTEVPSGLAPLRSQRVRWHIGLLDNLRMHRPLWRWRYGAIGWGAMPYTLAFEVFAPLLQALGYVILIVVVLLHQVSWQYAISLFVLALLFGQLQTAGSILIEELAFERYRTRDLLLIGGWGALEIFWYRPLTAFWRVWASLLWLAGRRPSWGEIPRGAALGERPSLEPELATAPLPR